ncbi:MAG: phospholipase D-like domain-containing protein [Sphingosinicella sp.]
MAERSPLPDLAAPFDLAGNRLAVVSDGPDRLEALLALIDGARESLRILYYIWDDDEAGRRVRDAVVRAGQRGVQVSLLVDGFGALFAADDFFQPICDTQAQFCRFEPRWGRRYLLRNHQKLTLADGERVLIGGFNISSAYFDREDDGAWRDLGLLVEGPLARELADYFDDLMRWALAPNASFRGLRKILRSHSRASGPVGWLYGGPSQRLNPWVRAVKHDLERAKQMDLIMCYFAPNPGLLRRIERIARRGVARIITPARSDWAAAMGSARHFHLRLLRRGVEVYEYQRTRLHTKLIVIDDVVYLGSANFDMRSLYLNLEIMLRIEDAGFAKRMRAYFEQEMADSRRITLEADRARRTLLKRILWGLHYFVLATDFRVARRLNFGRRLLDR